MRDYVHIVLASIYGMLGVTADSQVLSPQTEA